MGVPGPMPRPGLETSGVSRALLNALKYGLIDERPMPEKGESGPVETANRELFESLPDREDAFAAADCAVVESLAGARVWLCGPEVVVGVAAAA